MRIYQISRLVFSTDGWIIVIKKINIYIVHLVFFCIRKSLCLHRGGSAHFRSVCNFISQKKKDDTCQLNP